MKQQGIEFRILSADKGRSAEIKHFVLAMMSNLYPRGAYYENPYDLAFFEEVYIQPANANFFIAEDRKGRIVGTAAVKPYDRRFPEAEPFIGNGPVCEIVKFYIHPESRRMGIGSRLYEKAEQFAREAGYEENCLHTSLHLPGGYPFWQSRGYCERYWESERIVHMSKRWRK
ncbi:GNAT family N-acetyltransferase [Cohnella faecalis]|uniref:N-acetyltransferase n=1 Tax=Cohnella faecalis TaxID=2315694 RepID=A0A398CNW8_9BACL|nr:GNAT family N-acetyltransferase [Cohnella faecalis]RIE02969.1 N-acetyltransferase [Cohnella faecalis]